MSPQTEKEILERLKNLEDHLVYIGQVLEQIRDGEAATIGAARQN